MHTNNKDQFEDTKRVIESRKSKDRQHNGQKVEDTKRVIESRKSKDRQHKVKNEKDKRTNSDLPTQKTIEQHEPDQGST